MIIFIYGYFDYIGVIEEIFEYWDVFVYVYFWEMFYVIGKEDYFLVCFDSNSGLVVKLLLLFLWYFIDIFLYV